MVMSTKGSPIQTHTHLSCSALRLFQVVAEGAVLSLQLQGAQICSAKVQSELLNFIGSFSFKGPILGSF